MTWTTISFGFSTFVFGLAVGDLLPAYFRRKGENLATKEDIAQITRLQEQVKHEFDRLLELTKQRHSMRTIVAGERMAAHQEAFMHLKRLLFARDDMSVIEQCREWADSKCLYLTPEAREAFWQAIGKAQARAYYLTEATKPGTELHEGHELHDKAVNLWSEIEGAFQAVVKGVELPPLRPEDAEQIKSEVAVKATREAD